MSRKGNGRRKFMPMMLSVILLALVMIGAIVPTGAFEMTADMLRDMQGYFENTEGSLELNRDTLVDFTRNYLEAKAEDDPVNFPEDKMAELNALLENDEGVVDYAILIGLMQGEDDAATVNVALDMLQKVASADELIAFVETQEGYLKGDAETLYQVAWQIDGVTVATDTYRHMDAFNYPTKTALGLVSGEFVRWDCGAFFNAPDGDKVTYISGTVSNLAQELVDVSDGVTDANKVFHAAIDESKKQVVLALDVNAGNYMDVLESLMSGEHNAELKAELKALAYDVAAAGINAGVNVLSVNGHKILTVDSYELVDLVALLDEVATGNVDGLVSIPGIEDFIRNEDYHMARFTNMTEISVGGETYKSFGDYEFKLETEGLTSDTWTVSLCFHGDTSDIEQAALWLEEAVTVTDITGGKNIRVDLTNEKMQLILGQAYTSSATPDTIKNMLSRFETPEGDYFYVIDASMTVGQLKDLVRYGDYDDHLGDLVDGNVSLNQKQLFRKLLDILMDTIPAEWDDDTLAGLYDDNGLFAFDGERDKQWFEDLFQSAFGGFSFNVAGREVVLSEVIGHVFDRLTVVDVKLELDILAYDYYLYYVNNGSSTECVFMRSDMDPSVLFDNIEVREGYDVVFFAGDQEITLTPAYDLTSDTALTYEYRAREHQLTVDVVKTDPVTGDSATESKTLTVTYGKVLDKAYLEAVMADMGLSLDGYTVVLPGVVTMPDSDLTLTVECERIYFTVQWLIDGVLYDETLVAWGEIPSIAAPEKAADINYTYEFVSWDRELTPIYSDTSYEAIFDPSSRYNETVDENVDIGKDKENNDIVIDVVGPEGEGVGEIEVPMGPILEDLDKDPTQGLNYSHNFGDGYEMSVELSATELQHIISQLDQILEEKGKTYDDVTLRTSREVTTVEGKPAVKYEIIFAVAGEDVVITGNGGNTIRVNVDALTDPEAEYKVYVKNAEGKLIEIPFTVVDDNGKTIIEFTTPVYGEIYVVEEAKKYTSEVTPSENGTATVYPENAPAGETVTVVVTPDEGFEVDKIIVTDKDGNEIEVTPDPDDENKFTYEQPSGGATVEIIYKVAEYEVTFKDSLSNEIIAVVTVKHGEDATPPADPSRDPDAQYTYTFAGWDGDYENVVSDVTIYALYNTELNKYTITFQNWDGTEISSTVYYYGQTVVEPADPTRKADAIYSYTFSGWSPNVVTIVAGNATYTATYTEESRYTGNENIEVTPDPDDKDQVDINGDATEGGDGKTEIEIPMGPILEESEENEDLNLDITVDFGNGDYVDVDISADELQNIKDQLDKILEETGKTYEDVDFVVTRKEDTEDGNDTYTYDITFRVDGEDVDIESLGTEDANKITVTVPELDPGHEYVVEVYNPETGKFEELDEDQYTYTTDENGNPVIEVNTPWYTEIKVTEKILTFTVIFKYHDLNGNPVTSETVYEYNATLTRPAYAENFKTASHTYKFEYWMDENGLEIEIVDTVTADAYYEAYYTDAPIYEPDPDDPDDPTDDPDDIVVNQNPGSNDVTVDVTDKNDDDKVEIPMGPILEESEENEDLNLDITVDFGNGDYVDVDISADELQNIKDQLDKILEETGKTYEDVDFVVTRKEDTEDGNDTYTYDITFRVDGEDVDIESLGTEDANKITVTVPELDPGHEYV
ncbi:MAG: hypothetical protein E7661_08315, partial [Ruminococcaceae bacterium]|nr:hypothetical protein [Oscillospiraceae bacterium]